MRPSTSYLVCSTARSGSTYFCAALRKTCVAGYPDEYFEQQHYTHWRERWGTASFADYVAKAIAVATTPNGVCGIKMHKSGFLEYFIPNLGELPLFQGLSAPEIMAELFPNLHYIWLTRRDKVRQAVSLWRATVTGQWAWSRQQPTPLPRAYDFKQIDTNMLYLVRSEAEWQEYFTAAGVRPLTVVYEDFVSDYEQTVWRVLRYLGVEEAGGETWPKPWMRKQADEESERWVQRYREEKMRELAIADG